MLCLACSLFVWRAPFVFGVVWLFVGCVRCCALLSLFCLVFFCRCCLLCLLCWFCVHCCLFCLFVGVLVGVVALCVCFNCVGGC